MDCKTKFGLRAGRSNRTFRPGVLSILIFLVFNSVAFASMRVSSKADHTLVVQTDGTVWTWGKNSWGQLGDGTTALRLTPVRVANLSGIIAVAAGRDHSLALRADGTVWAWGGNTNGQLGDGTTTRRLTPVQASNISGVVAVAAGYVHSLALKANGTVWAWGANPDGQLGDGTTESKLMPVEVANLVGVVAIAAGGDHSLALRADGTVWTWGSNNFGQLGDGTTTNGITPVQVVNLTGVVAIAAGHAHSLVLKSEGSVWSWGNNSEGQLGDITYTNRHSPVRVLNLTQVLDITGGVCHSLALQANGTLWSWGGNAYGQLGDLTRTRKSLPVQVANFFNGEAITAGSFHSVALKADGRVWAWGLNDNGQLGAGTAISPSDPRISLFVQGPAEYTAIAAGAFHSYALKGGASGTVRSWGWNMYGQLGNGTASNTNTLTPTSINNLSHVKELAGGSGPHSIALKADGRAMAWGPNYSGQIGDGTVGGERPSPTWVVCPIARFKSVESGGRQSLGVDCNGTIWSWGDNELGQLGDGTTTNRPSPVQIQSLADVRKVRTGELHSLALKSDGTVWAWGWNLHGQLGDGTTTDKLSPIQINDFAGDVKEISAGLGHSLALKTDGTVWAWGWNSNGQLGDGTTADKYSPVQVSGLAGVKGIWAGSEHSIALKADGTIWAWGRNSSGQLGNGTFTQSLIPVQVIGLDDVADSVTGMGHNLALKSDGTLWAWGWNRYGQVGDGTTADRGVPTPVLADDCTASVPAGDNITVIPKNPVTGDCPASIMFSHIAQAGSMSVTPSQGAVNLVSNFRMAEPFISYNVITSAQYDGYVQVCIKYDEPGPGINEEEYRLYHYWDVNQSAGKPPGVDPNFDYTQSGWEDVTNPGSPDLDNNIICGTVTCLSPFMIGLPMEITAPTAPIQINTPVMVSVPYGNEGSAIWNFGDGPIEQGTISEDGAYWMAEHTYASPGVYAITLQLLSEGISVGNAEFRYIVVYDPSAGFVTGGGWIDSPAGTYTTNPSLTGKANFGFVSKYQKGATVPSGTTEFQFKAGDLNFFSNSYEWLVVAGAKAQFKGTGIINGTGSYKFLLTGIDAEVNSGDAFLVDRFRIRIWTEDEFGNESVVYDNALGDDADSATTAIGGGSIMIHKK